ncbi:MAG: hypothetical protein U0984_18795 [Prosthecobacter sp.]|nr:hypothetical protein [Prosthecobacter sp.]
MRSLWLTLFLFLATLGDLAAQHLPLHFKPHDHALGDVHPFFRDGECFLYYLKPGKYESALARSRDWLHWTETPLTHEETKPGDWMNPYFVLGVFRDPAANVYRSFYGHLQGRMVSSVSGDLLRWSCAPKELQVPPADYCQRRRDPFVFWMPETRQYGCVMTTWMKNRPKETGGAVSLATSTDLKSWKDHGPILDPGNIGEPECPQMFWLGGRWHLLASIYDRAVGSPVYWTSAQPFGPWASARSGRLDGKDLCAAQIAFDGDLPILFGWIPLTPAQPGKQNWGGHLALPREVYALADGTLGTRLPNQLSKAFAELPWQTMPAIKIGTQPGILEGRWHDLAAEFSLRMPAAVGEVRLRMGSLADVALQRTRLRILDAEGNCWSELPVDLPEDQTFSVQVFVENDIIELFVNHRSSLVARVPAVGGLFSLTLQTDASQAQVSALRLSEFRLPR